MENTYLPGREVYLVDGARTPFLKAQGVGPFSASDLAVQAGRNLLQKLALSAKEIDEVIIGCAMPGPDEANIGRIIGLRLGVDKHAPAWTVMRNCASGLQALDNAAQSIAQGRSDLVLAGGTETMSRAPILLNEKMANWLASWFSARQFGQKAKLMTKLKPSFLVPIIALLRGLRDPLIGLNMGQTAENLAYLFNISRQEMDEYAVNSHQKLARAFSENNMPEVFPMIDNRGQVYQMDTGLRADSTVEKLAKLKPFFDKKYGKVTAANSSQITDGAALLLLASAEAVKKYKLPVLAKFTDMEWAGLEPSQMGLGPIHAATPLLKRHQKTLADIDYWEINEAFAAQVLACRRAWQDETYCQQELHLDKAFGDLDLDKLNVKGDAIACGHPIGASGARIVLQLAYTMKENKAKTGCAAICIGGGQGGAALLENVQGV